RPFQFLTRVDLDQRPNPQQLAQSDEAAQLLVRERGDDQEQRVRPRRHRFVHLIVIENEILAQDGKAHGIARVDQVRQRPTEIVLLGQDGERRCARGFVSLRKLARPVVWPERDARGRSLLQLRDDAQTLARDCCGKVTPLVTACCRLLDLTKRRAFPRLLEPPPPSVDNLVQNCHFLFFRTRRPASSSAWASLTLLPSTGYVAGRTTPTLSSGESLVKIGAVASVASVAAVEACPGRDRRTALIERRYSVPSNA